MESTVAAYLPPSLCGGGSGGHGGSVVLEKMVERLAGDFTTNLTIKCGE